MTSFIVARRHAHCAVQTARALAGEEVAAAFVEHAEMDVQAIAGVLREGLRHEGRIQAVLARHALDRALHENAVVGRRQAIRHVAQVDFVLPDAVLRNRGIRGDALCLEGSRHVGEDRFELLQLGDAVHVAVREPAAGGGRAGRHRPTVIQVPIDEVKLELAGNHRGPAPSRVAIDHPSERMARVGEEGRAVTTVHAQQELRHRMLGPGHDSQGFRNRNAHTVGISGCGAHAGRGNLVSPDVERERGARKTQLPLHDLGGVANRRPLAAQLSVQVDDERFEDIDLRMGFEEGPGMLDRIGHGDTLF